MKRVSIFACVLALCSVCLRVDEPRAAGAEQAGAGAERAGVGAEQAGVGAQRLQPASVGADSVQIARASARDYLQIAEAGIARAQRLWWNRRLGWYDSRLHDGDRYPLATIWDVTPLFEALDAIAIARPTLAHKVAVERFAKGAERYWDAALKPAPGFAPYPGDRGQVQTWFDDNGWWGLAFLDAYQATGVSSYLKQAKRAFEFVARAGWNRRGGGLWWNTSHPYIAGEPLAAGSLLGARLFVLTGQASYRTEALKFLDWADASFTTERHLYKRTDFDPTPTPYIEGAFVEAWQVLCPVGVPVACERAAGLANASAERFSDRLNMGPQFDTIYLHWMLLRGVQAGETRWRALAEEMAADAQANARNGQGLYLKAWDGTPITQHQAEPNMLQSDAATLELFAWLAVPPQALATNVFPTRLASRAKVAMNASTTKASNWVDEPWRSSAKAAS